MYFINTDVMIVIDNHYKIKICKAIVKDTYRAEVIGNADDSVSFSDAAVQVGEPYATTLAEVRGGRVSVRSSGGGTTPHTTPPR